jgi:hypothetical protein
VTQSKGKDYTSHPWLDGAGAFCTIQQKHVIQRLALAQAVIQVLWWCVLCDGSWCDAQGLSRYSLKLLCRNSQWFNSHCTCCDHHATTKYSTVAGPLQLQALA